MPLPVSMKPTCLNASPSTTCTPSAIMSATKKSLPSGEARMSCGMPFHVVQITSSLPSGPLTILVGRPGWITCV